MPADARTIRFSTDDFPEREKAQGFRELYGRKFLGLEIEPRPDLPFYNHVSVQVLPDASIVSGRGSPFRVGRTADLIADGDDSLTLQMATCDGVATQLGREIVVKANDAIALSNADVGTFTFASAARILAISVPRHVIGSRRSSADSAILRPIQSTAEGLRLLRDYVSILLRPPGLQTPELRRLAATHLHDLIGLVFGATRDASEVASGRGLRAARLGAIKHDIKRHLRDERFSVDIVAARHGITPRYVQLLFESDGTTFSQFVLRERLALAHQMLISARFADHPISSIAFESGFGDLSYFNRAFRRQFQATPSDLRFISRRSGA